MAGDAAPGQGEDHSIRDLLRIRNVKVYYYIVTMTLVIWSFSFGGTFDAYLLELARSRGDKEPNQFVGSVETVRGMVALVLAWPIGVLSDRWNRRRLLQISGLVATVGILTLSLGILADSVVVIFIGVIIAAIFLQILMSCGNAFLADCVPKSRLTEVMTVQGSLFLLGYSVGPLVQMGLIAFVGDEWSVRFLHIFLVAGFCMWPLVLPAFLLLEKTPAERDADLQRSLVANADTGGGSEGGIQPNAAGTAAAAAAAAETRQQDAWKFERVLGVRKKWAVPIVVEVCSIVTAVGAGMTVKFFPLFFKEDYGFAPIALNGLSAGYTICIAVFVQICRYLSMKVGRCQAAFTWQVCGILALFALWKAQSLPLVIFLYILRGSFMNAVGPINSAIVLDCVDPHLRGRWSAIQSISRFSWSGSAVLGGRIADKHDYRFTFFITGLIYATSTCMYASLLCLVPHQQPPSAGSPGRAAASASGSGDAEEAGADGDRKDGQASMLSLQAPAAATAAGARREAPEGQAQEAIAR